MSFNEKTVKAHLRKGEIRKLFIEELGWDSGKATKECKVAQNTYQLKEAARKAGFRVWVCELPSAKLPSREDTKSVHRQLVKESYEHIIVFLTSDKKSQIWLWVRREPNKQVSFKHHHYYASQDGESLSQKLRALYISFEEEEIGVDITQVSGRAKKAFDLERVTKKFYQEFDKHRNVFLGFIEGIPIDSDREWYASVMLNRLMFAYFIQKKGFLDSDRDYLKRKLKECQQKRGENQFYSFYRIFLLRLFHEGLGTKKANRNKSLEALLGNIPYLNGGMFDVHELEHPDRYGKTIEINDAAFEKLFAYFDQYQWHLDERPLKQDNEINPDVLGYIFEKYINQKQMGAYYTKEDITEYIGKNAIIPHVIEVARSKYSEPFTATNSQIWGLLKNDPDDYIYESMRHGMEQSIPADALKSKDADSALDATLDKYAPVAFALPTETWREVIARRKRCTDARKLLASGKVRSVEQMVALNLDVRKFAQNLIEECNDPELLAAIWNGVSNISVLDPTGGSGAFLFAALNILEPLYEACLDRMETLVATLDENKGNSPHLKLFSDTLARAKSHLNRRYYVIKSIILNNLYAVDIMEEAVEICKLRLFLKLAAQVEPDPGRENLGIEPLPDIDFNVRAGNTLVGYATYNQVKHAVTSTLDFDDAMGKIAVKAADLNVAFEKFRLMQIDGEGSVPRPVKLELQKRLVALEGELNQHLAAECGIKTSDKTALDKWVKSQSPFHWFIEFHGILNRGGFDVILGNPPYAEIPKNLGRPLLCKTFKTALDRWSRDEDLYTLVVERSLSLLKPGTGKLGMILPLSLAFSTKKPYVTLREVLSKESGLWLWSHFDRIPSALFGNEVRTRCTIAILSRTSDAGRFESATTGLLRWNAEYRECLFETLHYAKIGVNISIGIPKVGSQIQADVLNALMSKGSPLGRDLDRSISFETLAESAPNFPQPCVFVGGTAYNWFPAWRDIPTTTNIDGKPSLPARTAAFRFATEEEANIVFALLCSSMGYWWWAVSSDAFNLKKWLMERFPLSVSMIPEGARKHLAVLGENLRRALKANYVYKDNKGRIGNFFLPACHQEVIAIDTYLGSNVPGLTVEFFEDLRAFNATFSRAKSDDESDDNAETD